MEEVAVADAVAVGIDVGGTKLVAAAVEPGGTVLTRRRRTSPTGDPDALLEVVADLGRDLGGGRLPVGVGVAGIVSPDGVLRYAPNLDVRDLPVGARLSEDLRVPVTVANDATVALYAELHAGAATGIDDVVMLTLGTGVGGAVAAGGQLIEGARGFAGELGHIVIHEGGRRCPCGNRGCLEAYASGSAIGARARELLAEDTEGSALAGREPIDGKAVTEAAHAGDALSRRVLAEAGFWLGVGTASLCNALDPARVVIGGGAAPGAAPFVLPAARDALAERLLGGSLREPPEFVLAERGDDAGMIGAALLALHRAG